jgi:hypothetical protein
MQSKGKIMKKAVAIAMLVAASLSAPVLPVQAATLSEWAEENRNCFWFGALKRECWEAADEAGDDVVLSFRDRAEDRGWNVGGWRDCDLAPRGSGHLIECE